MWVVLWLQFSLIGSSVVRGPSVWVITNALDAKTDLFRKYAISELWIADDDPVEPKCREWVCIV